MTVRADDLPRFYPPRPRPFFLHLARWLAPRALRCIWKIEAVQVDPVSLERLRDLRGRAAMVCPNHPSLAEPVVVFEAIARAGVSAYFLTAWETMADYGWFVPRLLQWTGCYSVQRGRRDRASIQMTRSLLAAGERIVIFPEGQTYGLNDALLPFQQGVVQIGFWALEEMRKRGCDLPLWIVPVAIKYVCERPAEGEIEASLCRLESRVGLKAEGRTPYERLRHIASAVVETLEREVRIQPEEEAGLDERITRLRDVMVARLASMLRIQLSPGAAFPDQVRALSNAYHDAVYGDSEKEDSRYERGLREQEAEAVRSLYPLSARLHNFLAIRDGYVRELPSAERFLDVLGRLEIEVLGKNRIRSRRQAHLRVGSPLDLSAYAEEYLQNRRPLVARLTEELQARVQALLGELAAATPPLSTLGPGSAAP